MSQAYYRPVEGIRGDLKVIIYGDGAGSYRARRVATDAQAGTDGQEEQRQAVGVDPVVLTIMEAWGDGRQGKTPRSVRFSRPSDAKSRIERGLFCTGE